MPKDLPFTPDTRELQLLAMVLDRLDALLDLLTPAPEPTPEPAPPAPRKRATKNA